MRSLQKNFTKMKYCLLKETENVTEQETYIDKNGVEHTIGTGTKEIEYGDPITFFANIQQSVGEAEALEFGLDVADYSATITTTTNFGITETTLIWVESEVGYKTVVRDGKEIEVVDGETADYKVVKVSKNLNQIRYILKRKNK